MVGGMRPLRRLLAAATTVTAVAVVGAVAPLPAAAAASSNAVLNSSAAQDLTGWSATAESGTVAMTRLAGLTGAPAATGVSLSRSAASGRWAYVLVKLQSP